MSVTYGDIIIHGSATMPDSDSTTQIGGAIDKTTKVTFADLETTGTVEVVSENVGDTTQNVVVHGRNAAGEKINEQINLNGQTPVAGTSSFERIMKTLKSATCAGAVAAMSTTNENTGTAQGGGSNFITLAAGASAVDDEYLGKLVRTTGGTGANQIREIVKYDGTSKKAYVRDWTGADPDATTTYEVADGVVFDKSPNEVDEVRRVCYDAAAEAAGGSDKFNYEKVFVYNQHATLALTNAQIAEVAEGIHAKVDFDLESTLNGTGDNGVGNNREVAPGGYTFNSSAKDVANSGNFSPVSGQGLWIRLDLNAGDAAQNSFWKPKVTGQST